MISLYTVYGTSSFPTFIIGLLLRNPKPCPILDVSDPGEFHLPRLGQDIDIRRDVPKYIVHSGDKRAEVTDVVQYWKPDSVAIVTGCSFTFEVLIICVFFSKLKMTGSSEECWNRTTTCRGVSHCSNVHHQHRDGAFRSFPRSPGGLHASNPWRASPISKRHHCNVSRVSWRSNP